LRVDLGRVSRGATLDGGVTRKVAALSIFVAGQVELREDVRQLGRAVARSELPIDTSSTIGVDIIAAATGLGQVSARSREELREKSTLVGSLRGEYARCDFPCAIACHLVRGGRELGGSEPLVTLRWACRERWLSGCRLRGCVDERGDLAQLGGQVIEFDRCGNSITVQRGDTKVFGVVGGEIRERNATTVNLGNRAITVYGCDFSPGTGSVSVAAVFRKVCGNGKVGKGGQRLLVRGRDGTRGAAPAIIV